jgi:hypothetical protein
MNSQVERRYTYVQDTQNNVKDYSGRKKVDVTSEIPTEGFPTEVDRDKNANNLGDSTEYHECYNITEGMIKVKYTSLL